MIILLPYNIAIFAYLLFPTYKVRILIVCRTIHILFPIIPQINKFIIEFSLIIDLFLLGKNKFDMFAACYEVKWQPTKIVD